MTRHCRTLLAFVALGLLSGMVLGCDGNAGSAKANKSASPTAKVASNPSKASTLPVKSANSPSKADSSASKPVKTPSVTAAPEPVQSDKPVITENEYNVDGLVLLNDTIGVAGSFDGRFLILGTVVNRLEKALNLVQIMFNVYDESGAQVGNAFTSVSGLEAGGRWNFKASAFLPNGRTCKVISLSGM